MNPFKGLFRQKTEKEKRGPRHLDHPRDLQNDDIIKFSFTDQDVISNQSFRVIGIDTCDLGGEKKTLFTLQSAGGEIRLAVAGGQGGKRGEEQAEVGIALLPEDVAAIFAEDDFIDLLDPDTGVHHVLSRLAEPERFGGWTAPIYRQEAGHNAYYHPGDYRHRSLPEFEEDGEGFSYYFLVSDDRHHGLEVQVYDGGRTEVYLLVFLPLSRIEELWPG